VERKMEDENNIVQFDTNEGSLNKASPFVFHALDIPYPNQAPMDILGRWQQLHSVLTAGPTSGREVHSPLTLLMGLETVKGVLRSFQWMNTAVEVKIVTTTTIFNYGLAFVANTSMLGNSSSSSGLGQWFDDGFVDEIDQSRRVLNNNPMIIDLSEQQEVTFELRWSFPFQFLNIQDYYSGETITELQISDGFNYTILWPLGVGRLDSTNNSTFQYSVYARFKDTILQGMCADSTLPPGLKEEYVTPQMMNSLGAAFLSGVEPVVRGWAKDQGAQAAKNGFTYLKQQGGDVGSWSCDYLGVGCDDETDEKLVQDGGGSHLSNCPDMWGELVMPASPTRIVLPCKQPKPRWHKIIDYIKVPCLREAFVYDFSDTQNFPLWPIRTTGAAFERIAFVANFFRFWRGSVTYIFVIAASPLISAKLEFWLSWNVTDADASAPPENNQRRVVTIRGTTIIPITIPFSSVRLWNPCVSLNNDDGYVGENDLGNMWPRFKMRTLQQPAAMGDVAKGCHIYHWIKPESDFQFSGLRSAYAEVEDNAVEPQSSVSDLIEQAQTMTGSHNSLGARKEGAMYLEEIGRRYSFDGSGGNFSTPFPQGTGTCAVSGNVAAFACMFLYYRGSFDWKFAVGTPGTAQSFIIWADNGYGYFSTPGPPVNVPLNPESLPSNGMVRIDPRYTSVLDFKASVNGCLDWWPVLFASDGKHDSFYMPQVFDNALAAEGYVRYWAFTDVAATPVPQAQFVRLGSDIGFAHALPPPSREFWPQVNFVAPGKEKRDCNSRGKMMGKSSATSREVEDSSSSCSVTSN
jgi:hypothetical protein